MVKNGLSPKVMKDVFQFTETNIILSVKQDTL